MSSRILKQRTVRREKRKLAIRSKVFGEAMKPRVTVFKSNRFFYAQAIDDAKGVTLCAVDGSVEKVKPTREGVKTIAELLAKKLITAKIENIVFDRNGYVYHGVVAAFADALRESGIKF